MDPVPAITITPGPASNAASRAICISPTTSIGGGRSSDRIWRTTAANSGRAAPEPPTQVCAICAGGMPAAAPTVARTRGLALRRPGRCCRARRSRWLGSGTRRRWRSWSWFLRRRCRGSRARVIFNIERLSVAPGPLPAEKADRHENRDYGTEQSWRRARVQFYGSSGGACIRRAHGGRSPVFDQAGGGARKSLSLAAAGGDSGVAGGEVVFALG